MPPSARYIVLGGLLLAGYYALIFGYAARTKHERNEHIAWRFPLRNGSDLCADALADGTVVASDNGTIYFIGPDGKQRAKFTAFSNKYDEGNDSRIYTGGGAPDGYAWAGGTNDSLLVVSVEHAGFVRSTRLPTIPVNEVVAIESNGKERWRAAMPPGKAVHWIAHSADASYVLLDDSSLQRYDLQGKLVYARANVMKDAGFIQVTPDNHVFVLDGTYANIVALDPDGKELWKDIGGGLLALNSRFGGDDTLYSVDANYVRAHGKDGKRLFATPCGGAGPMGSSRPYGGGFSWRDVLNQPRNEYGNWNYAGAAGLRWQAALADGGGYIYWISDVALHCLDKNGNELWVKTLRSEPVAVAAGKDGTAYVALTSGGVVAYSSKGRELWRNASLHEIRSAMSIGTDGRIYIEADGQLICLKP